MLIVGLVFGLVLSGSLNSAHAAPSGGALDISPDGSLFAYGPQLPPSSQPAGTCQADGASNQVTCHFTIEGHSGGAVQIDNTMACYRIHPDGTYDTTFDSHVVYSPSGNVLAVCSF
jgi:hypothetical protein